MGKESLLVLKSPWVTWLIVVVVVGLLLWFLLRGSKRFLAWVKEPVEPDKPRWTYILTPLAAALAPLAAFSVLLPSYLNQQRADTKFMAESQRTRTDAEWYRIRQDTETQEGRFNEAQARFGSAEEKIRAIAALQVAELSFRPRPTGGGAANDENYPHFSPTGAQLAIALQMEQNADVRAALREGLRKMIAFAGEKNNLGWRIGLINNLAAANRRVQRTFTESLGRYAVAHDLNQLPALQTLAVLAPFSSERDATLLAIRDLTRTGTFQADKQIGATLRDAATTDQRRQADAALIATIQSQAAHLMDVRDALAEALRAKPPVAAAATPLALPAIPASLPAGLPSIPGLPTAAAKPTLKLDSTFLAGANLWGATLTDAEVTGANFTGANLKHTELTGANIDKALRLSSSVTKGDHGPDKSRLPALKAKYPHFPWAEVEQREAAPAVPVVPSVPASPK